MESEEQLRQLNTMKLQDMRPLFVQQMTSLRSDLFASLRPVRGHFLPPVVRLLPVSQCLLERAPGVWCLEQLLLSVYRVIACASRAFTTALALVFGAALRRPKTLFGRLVSADMLAGLAQAYAPPSTATTHTRGDTP